MLRDINIFCNINYKYFPGIQFHYQVIIFTTAWLLQLVLWDLLKLEGNIEDPEGWSQIVLRHTGFIVDIRTLDVIEQERELWDMRKAEADCVRRQLESSSLVCRGWRR